MMENHNRSIVLKFYSSLFFVACLSMVTFKTSAQQKYHFESALDEEKWVDSMMTLMDEDARIGQLFMVAAYSNKNETHYKSIDKLITDHHIGGLIFFQGGPGRQVHLTNRYQSKAKVPLMIAMDAEWGLGMRLDSTISFPRQMTLGAISDDAWIYKMGQQIAKHCKRIGMQINFAPVIDVNVNPLNPVIGTRSFGENKYKVAEKGTAYTRGMQDEHVLANGKHFPGHGDTDTDSHLDLPVIKHDKTRLEDIELYPFGELFKNGLKSVMVAHIHIPALDSAANTATTLSPNVVAQLLKTDMKFEGLVFTDALNMKGVAKFFPPGEVDVKALLAGNDVLLYPAQVSIGVSKIKEAIAAGKISQVEIDERVRKILVNKYWMQLHTVPKVNAKNVFEDLNDKEAKSLRYSLFREALTVPRNEENAIPVAKVTENTFASISIGATKGNQFQAKLSKYAAFDHYNYSSSELGPNTIASLKDKTKGKSIVVVGLHSLSNRSSQRFGITTRMAELITELQKNSKVIVCHFGNPYGLKFIEDAKHVICAYEDNWSTRNLAPQLVFGAIGASGTLPVSSGTKFKEGQGIKIEGLERFGYSLPHVEGMSQEILASIDSIALNAIAKRATPGCQVLVARNGKIVLEKSYGYHTYQKKRPVSNTTVYDLASITKVASTMMGVMKLAEEGKIDLDKTLAHYIPQVKGTNKEHIVLRDMLSHQAGLFPYLEHWRKTVNKECKCLDSSFYCTSCKASEKYPLQVSPSIYAREAIRDSLRLWTVESKLIDKDAKTGKYPYKYSDLSFYLAQWIVENVSGQPIDSFVFENFYEPLQLERLRFHPLESISKNEIAPTEKDNYFRKTQLDGTVHDEGASMIGGVAGHAGLFGNAHDLAVVLQMALQGGYYGGQQLLDPKTIDHFTKQQFEGNRRGAGWDKTQMEGRGPTSEFCSPNTFGHSGFTGTGAWADPDYNLVYVFLSNRVYPEARNRKLLEMDVRTKIHDVIYESLLDNNGPASF